MTDDEIAEAVVDALGGVKCHWCGGYANPKGDQYHLLANAWAIGAKEPRPYVTACSSPSARSND